MGGLTLQSSAFSNGSEIPRKYGYKNDNVNPPLEISGISQDTQSLVLIMDDPDAQAAVGKVWVHWTIWNIVPNVTEIAESVDFLPFNIDFSFSARIFAFFIAFSFHFPASKNLN